MTAKTKYFSPCFLLLATLLATLSGSASAQHLVEFKPCSNSVKPAQQIEIGQKAAKQVYQQMPVLPDSSPVTQYVQALGQKLAAYAPGYRWPFNFHVADVADINAFALPGGTVFVNLGTIQAADDEAQLAAVMAHEMSHVVLEHSICNMEKQQRVGLLAGIGQLAAGLALGNGALGSLAQETIGIGTGLGFLKMSRGDEKQADMEGASILYSAGYDPRAMPQFFETIESKYGQGGAQFLSDHPNPGNRTDYIDKEIAGFPRKSHYVTNSPDFQRIHKLVAGMHAYTSKEIASGVWKHQGPTKTVSTGIQEYSAQGASSGTIDLAPPQQWSTFQGSGFTMQVPSTWRVLGNQSTAMIAPEGGIARVSGGQQGNLVYGVLTDVYTPPAGTPPDQAFTSLLRELNSQNPGMQPTAVTTLRVSGRTAQTVQSISAQANNGRGEQDWVIGIPANNVLRYFVFVAPQPDFNTLRPTFQHILNSIQLR
jgi:Zn-dependent protease with chaperone function